MTAKVIINDTQPNQQGVYYAGAHDLFELVNVELNDYELTQVSIESKLHLISFSDELCLDSKPHFKYLIIDGDGGMHLRFNSASNKPLAFARPY